jgi:asparagine synthase (glutamine-hydrolysing)
MRKAGGPDGRRGGQLTMCGIAGIHAFEPGGISREILSGMIAALRHRGPDEFGLYMDEQVGLAHARLSIVDLAGGSQPIPNEDRTLWIIFNGEIFNYAEIREGLLRRGHRFSTQSDTEVILHLFEEKGSDCLEDLNGQFAFAIWDAVRRELFLARDRVGILPLHFAIREGKLIFASEIKSLLAHPEVKPAWNLKAMDQIFTFWTPLPGETAFAGVSELKPGHYLTVKDGRVHERKYWGIPVFPKTGQIHADLEGACEEARLLLEDAVRIRLRADVEVGCYLSGGLDSSILASLANRQHKGIRTFGVGFERQAFDESDYQTMMSKHLGLEHRRITVSDADIGGNFQKVIWHCEKPLLRLGPVPLFLLSKLVRGHGMKVVLTGEGADEIFGGYNIFREALIRKFWSRRPQSVMRPSLIRSLYAYIFDDAKQAETMKAFFGQGLQESGDPLFSHLLRWRNTAKLKRFYSPAFAEAVKHEDGFAELRAGLPEEFAQLDTLAKAQYLETNLFMSNYLLSSQGDRIAMANSVEIRLPYLDHRLMEFMARVPSRWKILGLDEKFMLRKMFRGDLPDDIVTRPKHPYRAPISQSLRASAEAVNGLLDRREIDAMGIFDSTKVDILRNKLLAGDLTGEIENMTLAGILSTAILHSQFMKGGSPAPARVEGFSVYVDRRRASPVHAHIA